MVELAHTGLGTGLSERAVSIPTALAGNWCEFRFWALPIGTRRLALIFEKSGDEPEFYQIVSGRNNGTARSIIYIPALADRIRLETLGSNVSPNDMRISVRPLSRAHAAAMLFTRSPRHVLRAALGSPAGWSRRVRAALSRNIEEDRLEDSFELWRLLFDTWPRPDGNAFRPLPEADIHVLVICPGSAESAAAFATRESLREQTQPVSFDLLPHGASVRDAVSGREKSYVAILQAGEVLPPHATRLIGAWTARHGTPPALCTDEDRIAANGSHQAPQFKPEPNRALILSGTLTRGLWLFRRDWFLLHAAEEATWAETLRLELWLRIHEAGEADRTRRIPFLLASRREDTEAAPAAVLAAVVQAHLHRTGQTAKIEVDRGLPLQVRFALPRTSKRRVAIVIPSTLRGNHVRRCIRTLLEKTKDEQLEILLVISQCTPLDPVQQRTLAALGADRRLRTIVLPVQSFNYAKANNDAVRHTSAEFVCLLNDDVAPISHDWLDVMLGQFSDASVAAVGARLLYPNGTVQHGGVIMGMGGLADHAHRLLSRNNPGYCWRAVLNQEMSAVTGACMLVRRSAYSQVNGMDESFPIAFNDVDFCLRLRAAGHRVIYCGDAKLIHYESLSLGHHFSGERASLERLEVGRMRRRWWEAVANDPFHNPNLSLQRGQEWQLAFPPRVRLNHYLNLAS